MNPSFYGLRDLMELVSDFESTAHVDVEVVLKTSGDVKFVIKDLEADTQRTHRFVSINHAREWLVGDGR